MHGVGKGGKERLGAWCPGKERKALAPGMVWEKVPEGVARV